MNEPNKGYEKFKFDQSFWRKLIATSIGGAAITTLSLIGLQSCQEEAPKSKCVASSTLGPGDSPASVIQDDFPEQLENQPLDKVLHNTTISGVGGDNGNRTYQPGDIVEITVNTDFCVPNEDGWKPFGKKYNFKPTSE